MPIQLHAFVTPNGRKISVALEEMGLSDDVHSVDIGKGQQFDPALLAISPNNKIPAIVDPGCKLLVLQRRGRTAGAALQRRPAGSERCPAYQWASALRRAFERGPR